jgi:hypothetical protein
MDTHLPVRGGTHATHVQANAHEQAKKFFTCPYFCASSLQISINFDFDFDFPRIPSISCSVFVGSLGARRNEKAREGTGGGTSQAD